MADSKGRGSRRRRATKAPILDLDATDVTEEAGAEGYPEASQADVHPESQSHGPHEQPEASVQKQGGWGLRIAGIAAVFVAGTAAGAWLYRDLAANYVPAADFSQQTGQVSALADRLKSLETQIGAASDAATKLSAENAELKQALASNDQSPELKKALAAAETARQMAEEASAAASKAGEQVSVASGRAEDAIAATEALNSGLAEEGSSISEVKAAIETAAATVPSGDAAAGEAVQAVQAKLSALALKVAELEHKTDTPPDAGEPHKETTAKLSALTTSLDGLRAELKAAREANTAQESKIADLQQAFASAQDAAKLTEAQSELAKALAGLRTAVAEGRPFVGPVEIIRTRYPDDQNLQVLATHATSGVQTKTSLIADLSKVRKELGTALIPTPDPGAQDSSASSSILTTLQHRLTAIVKVRPAGTHDWPGLAERMEAQAKKGSIAEAVNLADSAGEPPPQALGTWLKAARVRVAVDKALAALSATAMADLAGARGTGG